jgi:hypothetical protein
MFRRSALMATSRNSPISCRFMRAPLPFRESPRRQRSIRQRPSRTRIAACAATSGSCDQNDGQAAR